MQRKKIIIVNDHAAINGGQAKVAIQSAVGLARDGHEIIFFAGSGPVAKELDHPRIQVICLDQADITTDSSRLRAAVRGVWNRDAARRLKAVLDQQDPASSIVHCHGFAKLLSGSIGAVIARHKIPHVLTMHEYALACPNAGFFDFPANEICHRRPLGLSCLTRNCDSRHAVYKGWRIARQIAINGPGRMPHGLRDIIYISETQRAAMAPYLGKARLHFVANPIEGEQAPPADIARNDLFVLVGRLSPEKGCVTFAQAARRAGVKAVFVGDGDERENIMRANPDAIITGWQTPAQVMEWMTRSRAVVFSSLWYECQPLVPLEALSHGVPVIAGRWSAASESVRHGVSGWHLQTPAVEELAGVLQGFTAEKAAAMGSRGYADFWDQPPTLDQHVAALQKVYASACL